MILRLQCNIYLLSILDCIQTEINAGKLSLFKTPVRRIARHTHTSWWQSDALVPTHLVPTCASEGNASQHVVRKILGTRHIQRTRNALGELRPNAAAVHLHARTPEMRGAVPQQYVERHAFEPDTTQHTNIFRIAKYSSILAISWWMAATLFIIWPYDGQHIYPNTGTINNPTTTLLFVQILHRCVQILHN